MGPAGPLSLALAGVPGPLGAATPGALLNPGLLWAGLGLAAVPIVIHLLNRRRVRRIRWAAMAWLLAAMKRNQRRLRMENWLILALRVAAIVLLGLALGRPILSDSPLAGLTGTQTSVYLLLDNSLSTEAKLDARSVLERVRHEADRVLASLGNDDSLAVLVTNDPDEDNTSGLDPVVLVPRSVGQEHALRAREAVALLRARHAPASWTRVFERLAEQMRDEDVNRQVVVVTDLQARDWVARDPDPIAPAAGAASAPDAPPAAPGTSPLTERLIAVLRRPARLTILDVGGRDRRNLSVAGLEVRGREEPFVGRPLEIEVEVANHGPAPVEGAVVDVEVGGRPGRVSAPVPPLEGADTALRVPQPGTQRVRVTLPRDTFPRPGSAWVRARVRPPHDDPDADALGLDSERTLALRVRDRIQVVAWTETSASEIETGQRDAADLYLRALYAGPPAPGAPELDGPAPLYAYRGAHSESELKGLLLGRDRFPIDLVVLANVEPRDEATAELLAQFVRAGGALLAFVGDRLRHPDAWNSAFRAARMEEPLLPLPLGEAEVRPRGRGGRGVPFGLDFSPRPAPHPLAEPFTNEEAKNWIQQFPPQIWGRMPFVELEAPPAPGEEGPRTPAAAEPPWTVVLRFWPEPGEAQGRPAVVEGRLGEGRTLWVATSVDNGWLGNAGYLFLPVFLEEAAMHLTRPPPGGANRLVGAPLLAHLPGEAQEVRFAAPGGRHLSPNLREEGGEGRRAAYQLRTTGVAGVWELSWRLPDSQPEEREPVLHYAVNPEPGEALLLGARREHVREGIPEGLAIEFLDSYAEAGARAVEARESEISRELLIGVIVLLLLESLLAMAFGRRSQATAAADGPPPPGGGA